MRHDPRRTRYENEHDWVDMHGLMCISTYHVQRLGFFRPQELRLLQSPPGRAGGNAFVRCGNAPTWDSQHPRLDSVRAARHRPIEYGRIERGSWDGKNHAIAESPAVAEGWFGDGRGRRTWRICGTFALGQRPQADRKIGSCLGIRPKHRGSGLGGKALVGAPRRFGEGRFRTQKLRNQVPTSPSTTRSPSP